MNTQGNYFQYKWELRLASTTTQTTTGYVYTYLRWVSGNGGTNNKIATGKCIVKNPDGTSEDCSKHSPNTLVSDVETLARVRHEWRKYYTITINGVTNSYTEEYLADSIQLPDDNAKVGTEKTGHLHMERNKWYEWGPTKVIPNLSNNGATIVIKVTMGAVDMVPRQCPVSTEANNAQASIKLPTHAVTPGKPVVTVSGPWYNHSVSWGAVTNAQDYGIQRRVNVDGTWSAWEWVPEPEWADWVNMRTYTPSNPFAYAPGTLVSYRVTARSSTNTRTTGDATPAFSIGGGVKIKVNGVWKSGTVYIKVNGVWRKADYIATKQNDSWKISDF